MMLRSFFPRISRLMCPSNVSTRLSDAYLHRTSVLLGVKGIEIKMPSLSPTMTEGTIVKWLKKEGGKNSEFHLAALTPMRQTGDVEATLFSSVGDTISPGDILCEIQTDKAVVAFELEEEGILAKILVPEETKDIKIGTLIALMVEEGQDWKDVEIPITITEPIAKQGTVALVRAKRIEKKRMMGPAVKTLLEKYAINPDEISSTGPHKALLKIDVINYVEKLHLQQKIPEISLKVSTPTPTATPVTIGQDFVDIPHTNMRRTIAKRLTESKTTIPHSYMSISCCIDGLIRFRKQLKGDGINVSLNDFIIKAVASALQNLKKNQTAFLNQNVIYQSVYPVIKWESLCEENKSIVRIIQDIYLIVPDVNVSWSANGIQMLSSIDISVAVATDKGLITPIIKDADTLGVQQISSAIKELAAKAREGRLQPHEYQGGSFSVSNLGMYGITEFSAVINPPQSSILAIGTSQRILNENGKAETIMTSTLSFDGRAVDDVSAAKFLKAFQNNLEDPINMIVAAKQTMEVTMNG